MSATYENIGEVNEVRTLRVSAHGAGLALFLPKDLCEIHGILAGHFLLVKMVQHFKPKNPDEPVMGVQFPQTVESMKRARHKSDENERAKPGGSDDLPKVG